MQFGVKPNYAWPLEGDAREQFENLRTQARVGVQGSFGSIWFPHQYLNDSFNRFQPVPTLAGMTGFVGEKDMGMTYILPLQNPIAVAENLATLDNQFDGTLYLAAIQGYKPNLFESFEVDISDRLGRFVESIKILRKLWTEDEVSFSGEHFSFEDVSINPKPRDEIPILIGGNVESAIRRAGRIGDGYLISARTSFDGAKKLARVYRRANEQSDRPDRGVMLNRDVYVGETTEQAIEDIKPMMMSRIRTYQERGAQDINEEIQDLDEQIEEFIAERFVGSPDECIARIEEYCDAIDPDIVVCGHGWRELPHTKLLESIERFSDEVIPHFTD